MPSLAVIVRNKFLKQTLVYWAPAGADEYGKVAYGTPVELACRWEDRRTEYLNPEGRLVMSRAYVLLADPIREGGLIFLGKLADWIAMPTYPEIPTRGQLAIEVTNVKPTPDIKAKSMIYEIYL